MSNSRAFAYNPSLTAPTGATQYGNLAVQTTGWYNETGGLKWWNGPDEDLGYVIARSIPAGNHPTPEFNQSANLTLSATYLGNSMNLSNGNQTVHQFFGYVQTVLGETLINNNDKVMFSFLCELAAPATFPGGHFVGFGTRSMNYNGVTPNPYNSFPGNDNQSIGFNSGGEYWFNGSLQVSGLPTWSHNDIIDVAVDMQSGYVWLRVNGGSWNNNPSENPATAVGSLGIGGLKSFYPALCPAYEGTYTIQNSTTYGLPTGFNFLGTNVNASVGFYRTNDFTDQSFLSLIYSKLGQSFPNGLSASNWLKANGYWTSYITPVLSLDAANWTSGAWVDSVGGKQFTLYNSPSWSSDNGGYFTFNPASSQYAQGTSLPSINNWTMEVWHYYTGTETGGAPCIITETYIGSSINYSLGNNNGGFSSGFFDGGWRVTDGYSLTPNNWYHIVGTYDGTTLNLYVNNVLVDTASYVGTPLSSGADIRLMRRWDLSDFWGGRLAIVNIYDKPLNQSQVTSKWNLTKSRFQSITIATNDGGGLVGWNSQALSVSYNPTLISTYPVGSTITFQDGSTASITQWDDYGPIYIDLFWDTPKTGTLFPITLSYV